MVSLECQVSTISQSINKFNINTSEIKPLKQRILCCLREYLKLKLHYPENVAYPVGGPGEPEFVVLEN